MPSALPLRKAVVLGAGTMGAQIAAHLVGCGLDVALLDLVPADAGADRNRLARRARETLQRLNELVAEAEKGGAP